MDFVRDIYTITGSLTGVSNKCWILAHEELPSKLLLSCYNASVVERP